MEEVVRAFNFVIEKGWVRAFPAPVTSSVNSQFIRRCTGQLRNGPRRRSRKRIVMHARFLTFSHAHVVLDVATKLNLIAPIAEQCSHRYAAQLNTEAKYSGCADDTV